MEVRKTFRIILISFSLLYLEFAAAASPPTAPAPATVPVTAASAPKSTPASTPSYCGGKTPEPTIFMESPLFWRALSRKTVNVYFADTDKCYYRGQVVSLFETKPTGKFFYWKYYRGTVTVYSSSVVKFADIGRQEGVAYTKQDLDQLAKKLKRYARKTDKDLPEIPVLKITVAAKIIQDSLPVYGSPHAHSEARKVSRKQLVKKLEKGEVYDIRPEAMRSANPLKEAKTLNINNAHRMTSKILSPKQLKRFNVYVRRKDLPKKDAPITIISACLGEFSAYNTLTLLKMNGFKNLSWFPQGYEGFRKESGSPCITPEKSDLAEVLDGRNVVMKKAKGDIVIIDTRLNPRMMMAGAINIPYIEKTNELNLPVIRKDITLAKVKEIDSGWDELKIKKFPTSQNIIVYGSNYYDWRPYKVAMILGSMGYKNVYWYRYGMDDWAQKVLVYPAYYQLNKKTTSKELY